MRLQGEERVLMLIFFPSGKLALHANYQGRIMTTIQFSQEKMCLLHFLISREIFEACTLHMNNCPLPKSSVYFFFFLLVCLELPEL